MHTQREQSDRQTDRQTDRKYCVKYDSLKSQLSDRHKLDILAKGTQISLHNSIYLWFSYFLLINKVFEQLHAVHWSQFMVLSNTIAYWFVPCTMTQAKTKHLKHVIPK